MNRYLASLSIILHLIRKEFLTTLKDSKSRVILLLPVLVQGFLFGYTATYNLNDIPYALVDQSHSAYSAAFLSKLDGSDIFTRRQNLSGTADIAAAVDSGDVLAVITIPADFADRIAAGETAAVQVITDGKNIMSSAMTVSYTAAAAASYTQELRQSPPLITVQTISWYNPNLISRWMFLPSLIPMIALTQVMILAGLSVAREREQGTFEQLLVTPLRPGEILIGKAVPPIVIGLVQATLMLCIAVFWFHVAMVGSLALFYITVFLFLISCVGIGLSISAVAQNMQQVMVYCFVFLLPMLLLSGLATPVRNMPDILYYATYANPTRFAIEAIRRIYLEGAGLSLIWRNFIPVFSIAAVTLPAAAWLFRHKLS